MQELTQQTTIKGEISRNLRYAQLHTKILYKNDSLVCFSLKSSSLIDLSIEGGLANATLVCYSSTPLILQVFLQ